jgi:tetratricopeptide (TPR) repeat protein
VEQWLFHRLAVFSSGFTLEAVTDLLAHTPDGDEEGDATPSARALELVTSLMGHSLLIWHSPAGGTPRFAMLGTVREYAADCLQADGELEPARREHARYMLALALRAMSEFSGPDQRLWIERIEADHDNVRAALLWSLEHDANLALQLSSALWRFWEIRGYLLEGQSWLERALAARGAVSDRVEATALNNLGNLTYRLSDYTRARRLYEQSLDISRDLADLTDVADSLNNLGLVASAQRDYQAARNFLGESLTLRREEARPDRLSLALHNLGEMEIEAGNPSRAPALLDEALALRQRRGDERGVAYVQYNLGRASLALGDRSGGKDSLRQALTTFRDVGEKIGLADALLEIGFLELERSHEQGAVKALDEGLRLRIDLGRSRLP